jgi:hypothetical protein
MSMATGSTATRYCSVNNELTFASASETRRPGFESRQGILFLGQHSSAVVY